VIVLVAAGIVAVSVALPAQEGPEAGRGFVNNGELAHTVAARDGSWTTGFLQPATWEVVAFDEPGTFRYHCTEHPWAVGEITVEP